MGSSHELVSAKKIGGEVCNKMFRDFPNSVDNSAICDKVESEGKKLDWLQKNQDICTESRDFLETSFQSLFGANMLIPSWPYDLKKQAQKSILHMIVEITQ